MLGAYPHLLVNHFPILGTIFGILILLSGIILKNDTVKQTGLATLVFAALMSAVALFTGDPAGEAVNAIPGTSEAMIDHHENMAYMALWILIPSGLLSAMAFYSIWKKEKGAKNLVIAAFALSLLAAGWMAYVAKTGGQIRHSELRSQTSGIPAGQEMQKESDDKD
ncbi:MAG: hypothetical protein ACOYMF_04740 [Bacteroidales bacterium]